MCGLAGVLLSAGHVVHHDVMQQLSAQLLHRGPDDRGFLTCDGSKQSVCLSRDPIDLRPSRLALVHRRLSIMDLTDAGWQPMVSNDQRYVLAFNGEVYNFIELRAELKTLGHVFFSESDTEVVLLAWVEWGLKALDRFVGMFAFTVVDLVARTLTLVRDQFGIKPLYWTTCKSGIAFASEIPALLVVPGVARKANYTSVFEYLSGGYSDRGENTMFEAIRRVEAGSYLTWNIDTLLLTAAEKYWAFRPETISISRERAVSQLRDLFLHSVELHMRSDAPVGIALSGGIDSTSILGAAHFLGRTSSLQAFSYISDDPMQNEESWIDIAVARYGIPVNKVRPEKVEFSEQIAKLVRIQGEPFASTGMFAQAQVFRCVSNLGVKVSLDGQGADEMLAGYPTYIAARLADELGNGDLTKLKWLLQGGWPVALRTLHTLLPAFVREIESFEHNRLARQGGFELDWFIFRKALPKLEPRSLRRDHLHDRLEQTLLDFSLPALLRYADRNSMAASVESRIPFLTPDLANFTLSLPSQYLINNQGITKAIFRDAMRGLVPDVILDRRDKIGFAVPEAKWLATNPNWLKKVTDLALETLPMLDVKAVKKERDLALKGHPIHGNRLWRWINLALWCREFDVILD
jgi:asparagine synthase (glutamine-hydrolysing)